MVLLLLCSALALEAGRRNAARADLAEQAAARLGADAARAERLAAAVQTRLASAPTLAAADVPTVEQSLARAVAAVQALRPLHGVSIASLNTRQFGGAASARPVRELAQRLPPSRLAFAPLELKGQYQSLEDLARYLDALTRDGIVVSALTLDRSAFTAHLDVFGV